MTDGTRYFLCDGSVVEYKDLYLHPSLHILGHLVTVSDEGRNVTAMSLWHDAAPTTVVPPLEPHVKADLVGDVRHIECELCHVRKQRWEIGLAGFLVLMGNFYRRVERLERRGRIGNREVGDFKN